MKFKSTNKILFTAREKEFCIQIHRGGSTYRFCTGTYHIDDSLGIVNLMYSDMCGFEGVLGNIPLSDWELLMQSCSEVSKYFSLPWVTKSSNRKKRYFRNTYGDYASHKCFLKLVKHIDDLRCFHS